MRESASRLIAEDKNQKRGRVQTIRAHGGNAGSRIDIFSAVRMRRNSDDTVRFPQERTSSSLHPLSLLFSTDILYSKAFPRKRK